MLMKLIIIINKFVIHLFTLLFNVFFVVFFNAFTLEKIEINCENCLLPKVETSSMDGSVDTSNARRMARFPTDSNSELETRIQLADKDL